MGGKDEEKEIKGPPREPTNGFGGSRAPVEGDLEPKESQSVKKVALLRDWHSIFQEKGAHKEAQGGVKGAQGNQKRRKRKSERPLDATGGESENM